MSSKTYIGMDKFKNIHTHTIYILYISHIFTFIAGNNKEKFINVVREGRKIMFRENINPVK